MKYKVTVFGVKDTTEQIVTYLHEKVIPIDLVIAIGSDVLSKNEISGYKGLQGLTEKYGIPVFEVESYGMSDERTHSFFKNNEFDIGVSMGWQRLIPPYILSGFSNGIFGFHGSCGYLPFGRGRSPLNWTILKGDSRFILNLFRYDKNADSPNVFANQMFSVNEHDTIRTLQYKNIYASRILLKKLFEAYKGNTITVNTKSKDFDSWYQKRSIEDGKIDFKDRTRNIYNLIRSVTRPFPGAFAFCSGKKVIIWNAVPFDEILDFSFYSPGEVIDVIDNNVMVRTVDGSLLIREYEGEKILQIGNILE